MIVQYLPTPARQYRYLTGRDAAKYVGISYGLLNKLLRDGEGPTVAAVSTGKRKFDVADLDRWLESKKRPHALKAA